MLNPDLRQVVESFVAAAVKPAMLDPGEEPLALIADQWSLSEWNGRLVLQAWDQRRNLVRKITGLKEQRRDRLCLVTERFQKAQAELQIADLAAPNGLELGRRVSRVAFCERFHLMLARELPDWQTVEVSAEQNLEESLSTSWARAFVRLGSSGIAVMAASPGVSACAGIVAAGLIWLDYLRRREKTLSIGRLLLYVPLGTEREVSFRAACLDPAKVACLLFAFDERDRVGAIDFTDAGNIESTLPPCRRPISPNAEIQGFPEMPDVDRIEQTDGSVSLQVRGLEFARASAGKVMCAASRAGSGPMWKPSWLCRARSAACAIRRTTTGSILFIRFTRKAGWNRKCVLIRRRSMRRFAQRRSMGKSRYSAGRSVE